jgi:hypothetical protein
MISVGGFLGIGQKNVAVPFAALQRIERKKKPYLILDTDKKTLTAAPGFRYDRLLKQWQMIEEDRAGRNPGRSCCLLSNQSNSPSAVRCVSVAPQQCGSGKWQRTTSS